VGLVLLAAAAFRVGLLDVPLDRDDGEYGYSTQLFPHGLPYVKLPGICGVDTAILAAFGQSPAATHLRSLVANAGTTVFVLRLAAHLYTTTVAVSAVVFAVLSLGPRQHWRAAL